MGRAYNGSLHAHVQIDKMMAGSELRTVNAVAARDIGTVDKNLEVVERAAATKARVDDLQVSLPFWFFYVGEV